MATRDILVLNTTASRAETQQGSDTVAIRGNSGEALSVENSSGTSILSVNTVSSSVDVDGKITATTNVSSSLDSSGSFGRLEATTLIGNAFNLTNSAIPGTISSSGQIANQISGSFRQGFEFTGTIGDTIPDQENKITASFGRIVATTFSGSAANLINSEVPNTISGSAQIASQISGAFTNGFEFDGVLSGSATSTGSFGRLDSGVLIGDVRNMTNILKTGIVSGSGQLNVSGSFNKGFEFNNAVSGSATSTGSFNTTTVDTAIGNISAMSNIVPSVVISGSAQIASNISGSFNKGFEFDGTIKTALGAWSAGGNLNTARTQDGGVGTKAAFIQVDSSGATEIYNGSSWSEVNDMINGLVQQEAAGSSTSALVFGGYVPANMADSEEWNGTNWATQTAMPISRSNHSAAGQTDADSALAFGGGSNAPIAAPTEIDTVEWNGSSWTTYSETGLGTGFRNGVGFGSTEAALYSNSSTFNKEWNGTAWSSISNTTITHDKGSGGGTVNDGVVFGGSGGGQCTELYDGTAWSAQGALAASRIYTDGGGTVAGNVLAVGAQSSPQNSTVEHFSTFISTGSFGRVEVTSISGDGSNLTGTALAGTVSGSAQLATSISGSFTSGFTVSGDITNTPYTFTEIAALNTGRQSLGASGIKTAGLVFGGYGHPSQCTCTETFNGSAWSEVNDMIAAGRGIGGSGTSTATVAFGGHPTRNQYTEEWNGTNWSEVNDMIRSDFACQAADIGQSSEAAIAAGSCTPYTLGDSNGLCNEEWNGTNWATANALIHNASQTGGGAGTANAGITAGGFILPGYPGAHRCTQLWNGNTWSESEAALPAPSNNRGILYGWGGSQNDAIITSGCSYQGALYDTSYCYNGISWIAGSAIGTLTGANSAGVYRHKGAGTTVDNSFFAGGAAGGVSSNTGAGTHGFCTDNGVATGSFTHIEAIRISGSVDGMTNIPTPEGVISSSAQIASSVSGSFNKGFEFDGEIRSLGAFSAGGTFPGNIKHNYFGGLWGTQNSALLGGGIGIYQSGVCDTLSYNGTSWSDTGANMINIKGGYTAHGTENAAFAAGGLRYKSHIFQYLMINTEEYNGSAWSATTNLPHQLAFLNNQKGGTQNAALIAGGYTGAGSVNQGSGSEAYQKTNVTWDGLSYTIGASMTNERTSGGFVGSMNTGLAQGSGAGQNNASTTTEEWNGTAWSDTAASNFQTAFTQTVGTSNDAMHTTDANSPVKIGCTDFYNGVSWQIGPLVGLSNSGCPKQCAGSAGSTSAGLFMTYGHSCVEHFDEHHVTSSMGRVDATELSLESDTDLTVNESLQIPQYATNPPVTGSAGEVWYNTAEEKLYFTYDVNSWTEMADTNSTRIQLAGLFGTTGAALHYGGLGGASPYPAVDDTEEWNGTTWTEVNDMNTAREQASGVGVVNAGLAAGGLSSPTEYASTEEWNGTNWTEVGDLNTARAGGGHAGTVNASVYYGGYTPTVADSEEWNGTAWTEGNNLIQVRQHGGFNGTQNTAWVAGGNTPSNTDTVEHYNGTSWSTQTALPSACGGLAGAGSQTAGMVFGGNPTNNGALEWNGQSWTAVDSMNSNHFRWNGDGTQADAIAVGGNGVTETYTTTGIGCSCIGGV